MSGNLLRTLGLPMEMVVLTTGEAVVDEFLRLCDQAVDKLTGRRSNCPRDRWIKSYLQSDVGKRGTCYLVVCPATFDDLAGAVRAVRTASERYSWLSLIVLVGDTPPEELQSWRLDNARVLPALDFDEEMNGLQWPKTSGG